MSHRCCIDANPGEDMYRFVSAGDCRLRGMIVASLLRPSRAHESWLWPIRGDQRTLGGARPIGQKRVACRRSAIRRWLTPLSGLCCSGNGGPFPGQKTLRGKFSRPPIEKKIFRRGLYL